MNNPKRSLIKMEEDKTKTKPKKKKKNSKKKKQVQKPSFFTGSIFKGAIAAALFAVGFTLGASR